MDRVPDKTNIKLVASPTASASPSDFKCKVIFDQIEKELKIVSKTKVNIYNVYDDQLIKMLRSSHKFWCERTSQILVTMLLEPQFFYFCILLEDADA
jgi:hypothetical protein